jgi:hypothetical protein
LPARAVDEDAGPSTPLGDPREPTSGSEARIAVEPLAGGRVRNALLHARARDRAALRSACTSASSRIRDADDDEAVGEVERGPVLEVEEVRHVPEPHAVDQVRDAAADHEPERDGQARDGASPSARRSRASTRRRAPSGRITIGVALANSPKAMPEFVTWWIENGPTTCTSSPRSRRLVTIAFVSWSAQSAATRDEAEAHPLVPASRPAAARPTRSG